VVISAGSGCPWSGGVICVTSRRDWRTVTDNDVPGPKVAEWAGHSVEILYRVYAHCLDDEEDRWYERMEHGLG
jgi:hypothetical protein